MGVLYSHCLIPRDNTIRPSPEQITALIAAWVEQRYIIVGALPNPKPWMASKAQTGASFWTDPSLKEPDPEPEPLPAPPQSFWARLLGRRSPAPRRARPDPMLPFVIPPAGLSWTALSQPDAMISWAGHPDALYPMETIADEPVEFHTINIELSNDFVDPGTDVYGAGGDTLQLDGRCRCGTDLRYEGSGERLSFTRIRRICPTCGEAFRPQDHAAEIIDGMTGAKIAQAGGLCRRFAISIDFGRVTPC
ncbi:hypothetical protein ACQR1I_00305 [Bradyrhizobium sp. HKCCYLS2038]|uniref:hypothetical protein n=1 Tax=unclassified Bradyrhizobium TaxID=2631580 RepID=UPI003EC109D8